MKKIIFIFFPFLMTQMVISQVFTEQTGFSLTNVYQSSVDWGDYDSDGDLDILLNGYTGSSYITRIYRNDDSIFTDIDAGLTGTAQGSVDWGDYDNDGDLDILLTGMYYARTTLVVTSKIYRNDNGVFNDISAPLTQIYQGSGIWGDYDNDGDLDILMTGRTSTTNVIRLYQNNNGAFTLISTALPVLMNGSVAWGDYDNDGDLDILLRSSSKVGGYTKIYRNDDGVFTDTGVALTGVSGGKLAWGDYDNDGDLDILITGFTGTQYISSIFRNDEGVFTDINAGLTGVTNGAVAWGDCDNDGDLDVFLSGTTGSGYISCIYQNNDSVFTDITPGMPGIVDGTSVWGDYDNDGDLDILLTGNTGSGYVTRIYRNDIGIVNTKPAVPGNLQVEINDYNIVFKWDKATDDQTAQDGLAYNLYVYEEGQADYIRSPHAFRQSHTLNGKRFISETGTIQWGDDGYKMKGLPFEVTYYWSVQATDAGMMASEFAAEQSFYVPVYTPVTQATSITLSNIQASQVTASWKNGSGSQRVVFFREGTGGTADPVNNTTYALNSYTPGGWKCIYNGTGNTVNITGLTPGIFYSVHVCEYNGPEGHEKYLSDSAFQNPGLINTLFSETGIVFPSVSDCSFAWGDYDNDDDLDVLLTGDYYNAGEYNPISRIYQNNAGAFTDINAGLIGVYKGSVAWGDYDGDEDLDILLTGLNYSGDIYTEISRVYRNDSGLFNDISAGLQGVYNSAVAWGDYDNDGDLDILLTGQYYNGLKQIQVSKVYNNNAGIFKDVNANLMGVSYSTTAWGDYDNDGDLDILLTGENYEKYPSVRVSRIYRNDNESFNDIDAGLTGIFKGTAAWGDCDSDGDLDILMNGSVSDDTYISKIYRNDQSLFTEINAGLENVYGGSAAWGDYDNDGDLDILLTGNNDTRRVSIIYDNDTGSFTEARTCIPGTTESNAAWGDFDNDNDLDILLTGYSRDLLISTIFRNNCDVMNSVPDPPSNLAYEIVNQNILLTWNGVETDETPVNSLSYNVRIGKASGSSDIVPSHSSLAGYRRIVEMGNAQLDTSFLFKKLRWDTIYYASVQAIDNNFQGGGFSSEVNFNISPLQASALTATNAGNTSLMLRWERGDGDRCIVFAKEGSSGFAVPQNHTTYYYNPVFGEGSPLGTTDWFCIYKGEADSVLFSGLDPLRNYIVHVIEFQGVNGYEVYSTINTSGNIGIFSASLFSEQQEIVLTGIMNGSAAWGDYNNDGYLDLIIAGETESGGTRISEIYCNNGGIFTNINANLQEEYNCSVSWGDYDNDNDLDLLICGHYYKIYRNDNGTFQDIFAPFIYGFSGDKCSASWADYDNDGDLDVLINGGNLTQLYRNDKGEFIDAEAGLPGVQSGASAWGDYDNDGDLDILLTGYDIFGICILNLYRNDNGVFSDVDVLLPEVTCNSVAWGDCDNDGDLDILLSGIYGPGYLGKRTEIYRNDLGVFTSINSGLTEIYEGTGYWIDFNNDGFLDVILTGSDVSEIFINNSNSTFSKQQNISLPGVTKSHSACGDYDNDGDMDILLTGLYDNNVVISKIFRNNFVMRSGDIHANSKPGAPEDLIYVSRPNGTKLSWTSVKNDDTPYKAMSYNVRIGTEFGTADISAGQSDPVSGYRRLASIGNAQLDSSYLVSNIPSGKYYWNVQAVDQGYMGGDWSAIDSFIIRNTQAFFISDTVCQDNSTHFTDQSVVTDGIASWHWDFGDGAIADIQNPEHTFTSSGNHLVKLVITSLEGDKDSLEQTVIVKPRPVVDFSASTACQGEETVFTNLTDLNNLNIESWVWDYGDGKGSIIEDPVSHGYLSAGEYQLTLYAIADNGCEGSMQKTVTVGAYPVAVITADAPLSFCEGDSVVLSVGSNADYTYNWLLNGVGITDAVYPDYKATLSGNYVVEVINTKGNCKTTSSPVMVTSLEMPAAPVIITSNYIPGQCQSDNPITLSVEQSVTGYNYQWKRNGVPMNDATMSQISGYLPEGDYSVVAGLSTCRTESIMKTISYDEAPAKPLIHAEGPVVWFLACSNDSAAQYRWYYEGVQIPGADKYIYVANQDLGEYYVSIANIRGCFTTSDIIKIPPDAIGIDEADVFSTLKIFPNPTAGLFTIVMNNQLFGDVIITIFTEEGKKIWNTRFDKIPGYFSCEVDLRGNGSGVYFINLRAGNKEVNRKLVIQ